jgi:hypothetical protein
MTGNEKTAETAKKSCALCSYKEKITQGKECHHIWSCKIYTTPETEYKHFKPIT